MWDMVDALQQARGSVSIVSLVILMWSSLKFFQALVRALNRAWRTDDHTWWQLPLKNLIMLGVIASGFALGIILPALIQTLTKVLSFFEHHVLIAVPGIALAPVYDILGLSRYLVGGTVLFYTITMLYSFAPRRRVLVRNVWMPALLVTIVLQVVQIAVINYLPQVVNYNTVYGSIGSLMLLLFWIYLSGIIIITGGCLCAALAEPSTERTSPR